MWGVDSAARVTNTLFSCVQQTYGNAAFWGRYVTTVANVSDGLTKEEIAFLHRQGVKIAPIYNAFRSATQYEKGVIAARNALFHAHRLQIAKNTVLFANIEDDFAVDEAWLRGWVDTFYPSGYRPGVYANTGKGAFPAAYCEAVKKSARVAEQTIIWSSWPRPGTTTRAEAPSFRPQQLPCASRVWLWQYGRDASVCPIDTNVVDRRIFNFLY